MMLKPRHIILPAIIGLLIASFAVLGVQTAYGFSDEWSEGFEGFNTGTINGQGNWTAPDYPDVYQVSEVNPYDGLKHLRIDSSTTGYKSALPLWTADTGITEGVVEWSFKLQMKRWADPSIGLIRLISISEGYLFEFLTEDAGTNEFLIRRGTGGDIFDGKRLIKDDSWATIKLTLDFETEYIYLDVNYKGEDWPQYSLYKSGLATAGVKGIGFECYRCGWDIDGFGYSTPPLEPSVWGVSPASTTEITETDTNMTVGYEDLDDYETLYITLRNPATGLFTGAKSYEISEIGGSGELIINLQDLNLEYNGDWYLHATAVKEGYLYESEMFLSGYGYVWSDDLTDKTYYLDINISGLLELFTPTVFDDWYGINSTRYDTPTDLFLSITGFFTPVLGVIGSFGESITKFFNLDTSYNLGFNVGKMINLFGYILIGMTFFLGGFAFIQWFLIIIALLVGIFLIRFVLKFIPGLG